MTMFDDDNKVEKLNVISAGEIANERRCFVAPPSTDVGGQGI
jgi:hypothetical protein